MGVAETLPCLVVGAGPTGLALAAQVTVVRVRFRIIDRSFDRVHESRALAIQARTLEILDSLGSRRCVGGARQPFRPAGD